jgi:hypothetical protein
MLGTEALCTQLKAPSHLQKNVLTRLKWRHKRDCTVPQKIDRENLVQDLKRLSFKKSRVATERFWYGLGMWGFAQQLCSGYVRIDNTRSDPCVPPPSPRVSVNVSWYTLRHRKLLSKSESYLVIINTYLLESQVVTLVRMLSGD